MLKLKRNVNPTSAVVSIVVSVAQSGAQIRYFEPQKRVLSWCTGSQGNNYNDDCSFFV